MTTAEHPMVRAVRYHRKYQRVPVTRCGEVWSQGGCASVCRLPVNHDTPHGWFRCEDGSRRLRPFLELEAERVAHSFAIKYGLREHLTYQQAMGLERDLTTHLRAWLEDPS